MDSLLNILKAQAGQLDQTWAQPRLAIVTSVNPQTYTARVTMQPENILSGWLPIAAAWVGGGWGLACPPTPGDQVLVIGQEGDAEQGIIVGRVWSSQVTPPACPSGEFWLVHQSGSSIKLHNDGTITSSGTTWTHTGTLYVTGDVHDSHGSMAALRGHYNEHVHPPSNTTPSPTD